MTALQQQGVALRNAWKERRSQAGSFDLPSIIVGVVIVGILTVGVLASIFGVIPFAQDNAAKQDLASVNTAEGVAKTRIGLFKDKGGLLAAALMGDAHTLAVGSNTTGSCFVGVSKSGTGTVFYNSDQDSQPAVLTPGTATGCLDPSAVDALVTSVGGYPASTSGTTAAAAPASGSGGATALPAGYSWSNGVQDTNRVLDPGFENGTAGWAVPSGTQMVDGLNSNVLKSLGSAPGMGIGGTNAVQLVTSGTIQSNQANEAMYDLPADGGQVNVSFSSPSTTALDVYAAVVTYNSDGSVFSAVNYSHAYVGGTNGWQAIRPNVPMTPAGGSRKLFVRIGANYSDPSYENAIVYVDHASATDNGNYFDGSTAASGEYSYSWSSQANNSVSQQVTTKRVATPSTMVLGQTYTLQGRGFPANTQVTIGDGNHGGSWTTFQVTTDASGNFTTDVNFPANTDPNAGVVAGPNTLSFWSGWSDAQVIVPVTFQ